MLCTHLAPLLTTVEGTDLAPAQGTVLLLVDESAPSRYALSPAPAVPETNSAPPGTDKAIADQWLAIRVPVVPVVPGAKVVNLSFSAGSARSAGRTGCGQLERAIYILRYAVTGCAAQSGGSAPKRLWCFGNLDWGLCTTRPRKG